MTSELAGLSGGSGGKGSSNGNGNGNGRGQRQGKNQKEKDEYSTFKYSTRFTGPLHEAVVIGNEPFFITYSAATGHLEAKRRIEETNRILAPPYPEEYPYDPFEFQSISELREFEDMAMNETIDSLYQKAKSQVSLYVDQDDEVITLISADIIWTFFQDLFPTTHYYDITGKENGIGKSTMGHVFEGLGYRGVRMTDPSAANLYRILGRIEAGQCIIVADEADRIHQDKDMLAIMKEGYSIRGKVPKINSNTTSLRQEFFYCYCFKIRIAEEALRANVTKGVIDRSFHIKATRGKPMHDIKEVMQPANRNERLEKLHNDLRSLRKLLLAYRLIHFDDPVKDIRIGLEGRDKELSKPLLQLFHGTKAYNEVKSTLQIFLDRKNKRKKNTAVEPVIYGIVIDLVAKLGREISTDIIWNGIKSDIPGVHLVDDKKPNEYQTNDYDTIYRNPVSKMICDNFGAEREHRRDGNIFVFDLKKLAKAGKVFDTEASIQAKLLEQEEQKREGREGREGQHSHTEQKADENLTDNIKEDENISKEYKKNQKISDKKEGTKAPKPDSQPSQPSQPSQQTDTPSNIYRIAKSDRFGCNECKLKGDKWFMQEHNCRGLSKSKVADAAAANMRGNGILENGNGNGEAQK